MTEVSKEGNGPGTGSSTQVNTDGARVSHSQSQSQSGKLRLRSFSGTKQALITPESRYWKSFKYPVLIQQYAAVTSVSFSPVAPYDFAVTSSTRVLIYDAANNQVRRTLARFMNVVSGLSWRADGRVLLTGGEEGLVRLCDVNSREVLRTLSGHTGAVHATAFLRSDGRAVSGGDDTDIRVFDLSTGQSIEVMKGHSDRVRSLAVLDSVLAVSGSYDHSVRVWDTRQGKCVSIFSHDSPVEALAILPGASQIASVGGTQLRILDVLSGTTSQILENHQKTVTGLAIDPSRGRLLTSSLDQSVKVYSSSEWQVLHTLKYPAPLLAVAFSPSKTHLVTGMVDGMLSIRCRSLGSNSEMGDEDSRKSSSNIYDLAEGADTTGNDRESLHDWRYWERGMKERAQMDDYIPLKSAETKSRLKEGRLKAYDHALSKFQYKKSLDEALLGSPDPVVICSLLEELSARGALSVALAGRSASTLAPLLHFLISHVTLPAYARVLIPIVMIVLEMYASVVGLSSRVDKLLRRLQRVVKAECEAQKQMTHTLGILDTVIASQAHHGVNVALS